jgi:hypothetical protein
MRVIDRTPAPPKGSYFNRLQHRIKQIMDYGFEWEADQKAQTVVIDALGKSLNNRFILLRNIPLEGLEIPIPSVLVGPPGLFVIYTSALKGIYRAKNETWAVLRGGENFQTARPNLITRVQLMTQAVEAYLTHRGHNPTQMQGVMIFTHPGTHVDAIRPAVRIVLIDGLEHYISGLVQSHSYLSNEEVQTIVDLLAHPPSTVPEHGEATAYPTATSRPISPLQAGISKNVDSLARKLPFSSKQWILLGVITVMDILILLAFIIILFTLR